MKQPEPPAAFQSSQFGYAAMPSSAAPSAGQQYAPFPGTQPQQYEYAQAVASPAAPGAPADAPQSNSEIPVGAVLGIPVRVHVLLPAGACCAALRARAAPLTRAAPQ